MVEETQMSPSMGWNGTTAAQQKFVSAVSLWCFFVS